MLSALIASVCVASLSLIGVFFFRDNGYLNGSHRFILPTAVGVFLGIIFFELIPETLNESPDFGPVVIIAGFLGFYLLSHFLDTYHHHHFDEHDSCSQNGAQMLLIGHSVHTIADGIVIATAFILDPTIGMITTLGIALHEIPQEIAQFGVLLRSGYTRNRAVFYNLLSASSVVVGVLLTYGFASSLGNYVFVITGVAAGNLLYIATTDFIPELRHSHRDHFFKTFTATVCGVLAIGLLVTFTHALR